MESSKSKSDAHYMHGWRETRAQLETRDVVCNEWRWRQHELTRRLRAHSLVRCRISCALCGSWLPRRHWCRPLFRSVSPRVRNPSFFLKLQSDFISSSSIHTVAKIIACCTSRKRVIWGVVFTQIILDFLKNLQRRISCENILLEFNWFSIDSQQFFETKGHFMLPLDLSILQLQLCCRSSSPGIVRNLSKHVLLLMSTGSHDHETRLISSMREMHFQSYAHSEFLQNAPISISAWYWTSSEFLRNSCSCRPPSSPNNSVQYEWLLSLTKT